MNKDLLVWFNDLCTRRKITFEEQYNNDGTAFECSLYIDKLCFIGHGSTKKNAKRDAVSKFAAQHKSIVLSLDNDKVEIVNKEYFWSNYPGLTLVVQDKLTGKEIVFIPK